MKASVYILYTGGTFGMIASEADDALSPASWEQIAAALPSFGGKSYFDSFTDIDFTFDQMADAIDSSDQNPSTWREIAERVQVNYAFHDGFILIHGTDTLAYTASALSFVFQHLDKPVVLTGSQLPVFHYRTDAIINLSNAIAIAAYKSNGLIKVPEVCICFNDDLLRGNRASKTSTNDFDGFYSPNYPNLGSFQQQIAISEQNLLTQSLGENLEILPNFNSSVVNVTIFPGYDPSIVEKLILQGEIKGIVLRAFGAGNVPNNPAWNAMINAALAKKVIILVNTQCPHGKVQIGQYLSSKVLEKSNVINGIDITNEAALTKLMWVLANYDYEKCLELLSKSIKGE